MRRFFLGGEVSWVGMVDGGGLTGGRNLGNRLLSIFDG